VHRWIEMACFITPLLTGIIVELARRLWRNSSRVKLYLLSKMLLLGSLLLVVEHAWHGEVTVYPPFLTAMQNPSDIPVLINEVISVGGAMTLVVTATWGAIVSLSRRIEASVKTPVRITSTLRGA